MKNTLQFQASEFAPINTTVWHNPQVTILLTHDTYMKRDILLINATHDNLPIEIVKISDYIDVELVTDETILITGLNDCKSITVLSNGSIKMKIEL
jgi:hypothetical protein